MKNGQIVKIEAKINTEYNSANREYTLKAYPKLKMVDENNKSDSNLMELLTSYVKDSVFVFSTQVLSPAIYYEDETAGKIIRVEDFYEYEGDATIAFEVRDYLFGGYKIELANIRIHELPVRKDVEAKIDLSLWD